MREVILNYWNWFADLVNPYHDVINTISTIVIAAFTVVLARVALKQTRDARILQRAYLNVKFGGIQSDSAGKLVGYVTFQNVGHLPARKFYWLVKLNRGGSDWRPPKIKGKELEGDSVIPIGAENPGAGSHPAGAADEKGSPRHLFLFVTSASVGHTRRSVACADQERSVPRARPLSQSRVASRFVNAVRPFGVLSK